MLPVENDQSTQSNHIAPQRWGAKGVWQALCIRRACTQLPRAWAGAGRVSGGVEGCLEAFFEAVGRKVGGHPAARPCHVSFCFPGESCFFCFFFFEGSKLRLDTGCEGGCTAEA